MAKTKVISVANQKGGVGKSTSLYCISAGLAAFHPMDTRKSGTIPKALILCREIVP